MFQIRDWQKADNKISRSLSISNNTNNISLLGLINSIESIETILVSLHITSYSSIIYKNKPFIHQKQLQIVRSLKLILTGELMSRHSCHYPP